MGPGERVVYGVGSCRGESESGGCMAVDSQEERGFWLLPETLFFLGSFATFIEAKAQSFIFRHTSGRLLFL